MSVDKYEFSRYNNRAVKRESAGTGRQARLRGVWQQSWEFDSPLSHHKERPDTKWYPVFLCGARMRRRIEIKTEQAGDCMGMQFSICKILRKLLYLFLIC